MDIDRSLAIHRTKPVGAPYVLGLWHHDRASLRGFDQEARTFVKSLYRNHPGEKFVILGRARSGTTLLTRLLNALDDVHCAEEVLHYRVLAPVSHLRRLARISPSAAYGCKVLSYQIYEVQRIARPQRFFQSLHDSGFRIIHLVRDTFTQSVSLTIAQETRRYVQKSADGDKKSFDFDPAAFVRQLRWNEALLEYEHAMLANIPHFTLSYERDLQDSASHQATIDAICQFLGVASGAVSAPIRKILDADPTRSIRNFPEVLATLRQEGLGHLVDPVT